MATRFNAPVARSRTQPKTVTRPARFQRQSILNRKSRPSCRKPPPGFQQPGDHAGLRRKARVNMYRRSFPCATLFPLLSKPIQTSPSSCTRITAKARQSAWRQSTSGFSSVMMDGSLLEDGKTPSDYEYNVAVSSEVVKFSHAIGVTVEAELGCLGSLETGKAGEEDGIGAEGTLDHAAMLTDPEQAVDFVTRTQCDALAIAIGTSHGAYKFTRKPTGDILAIDLIKRIHARLPNTHLVMHGSSSVPQDLLAIIREYGGDIGETYGVPVEEIVEGIKYGVRKINIDTDIRLAMTAAIRKYFVENPSKFDPRDYLKPAREAAKLIVKARFEAFGCAGQAGKIKAVPLDKIAAKYKNEKNSCSSSS